MACGRKAEGGWCLFLSSLAARFVVVIGLRGEYLVWTEVAFSACLFSSDKLLIHLENVNMMGEPVQQSAGQTLRTENFGPFGKRKIAGD